MDGLASRTSTDSRLRSSIITALILFLGYPGCGKPLLAQPSVFVCQSVESGQMAVLKNVFKEKDAQISVACIAGDIRLVHVKLARGTGNRILESLPVVPFRFGLDLSETDIDDAGIYRLTGQPHLVSLNVSWTKITDKSMAYFRGMNIIELMANYTRITDSGLSRFCESKAIKKIELSGTRITSNSIRHLSKIDGLVEIDLSYTTLSKERLMCINNCKNLTSLNLSNTRIDDSDIPDLLKLDRLCFLDVRGTGIKTAGLLSLVKIPKLKTLLVDKIDDDGILIFKKNQKLHVLPFVLDKQLNRIANDSLAEHVDLSGTSVTSHGVASLLPFGKISHLRLGGSVNVSLAAIESIASQSCLQSLSLPGAVLTDDIIKHLSKCSCLDSLEVRTVSLNSTAIDKLVALRSLCINEGRIPVGFLRQLAKCHLLTHLNLGRSDYPIDELDFLIQRVSVKCLKISDCTDTLLKTLAKNDRLHIIDRSHSVTGGPATSDDGVARLDLSNSSIGSNGLASVLKLRNLKSLNLADTSIDGPSLRMLARLPLLEEVDISSTGVSDSSIEIFHLLKHLTRLDLSKTSITDECVVSINNLSKLTKLNIGGTRITSRGICKMSNIGRLSELSLPMIDDNVIEFLIKNQSLHVLVGVATLDDGGQPLRDSEIERLDFSRTKITDVGVAHLLSLQSLATLNMSDTIIGNKSLVHLAHLRNIINLSIANTKIDNDGMASIAACINLVHLDLSGNKISDDGLKKISRLKKLSILVVDDTDVTYNSIVELASLHTMTRIFFSKITNDALAALSKTKSLHILPVAHAWNCLTPLNDDEIVFLDLSFSKIDNSFVDSILQLKNLESLDISMTLADEKIVPKLSVLVNLEIVSFAEVTDSLLFKLTQHKFLRVLPCLSGPAGAPPPRLYITYQNKSETYRIRPRDADEVIFADFSNTEISDASIPCVKQLSGLLRADISNTSISNVGLLNFGHLEHLMQLNAAHTRIDPVGVLLFYIIFPNAKCKINLGP